MEDGILFTNMFDPLVSKLIDIQGPTPFNQVVGQSLARNRLYLVTRRVLVSDVKYRKAQDAAQVRKVSPVSF